MIPKKAAVYLGLMAIMAILVQCNKDDKSINFFSVNQDIEFGASMDTMIMDDQIQFPVLSESQYPTAYQHIRRIRDNILASGEVKYSDRFPWVVKIIHNDTTLNAFAAPGGYMYFYTGIIRFLDNEAMFAGVMAHEMAHCDRRHSTDNLTKQSCWGIIQTSWQKLQPGLQRDSQAWLSAGRTNTRRMNTRSVT